MFVRDMCITVKHVVGFFFLSNAFIWEGCIKLVKSDIKTQKIWERNAVLLNLLFIKESTKMYAFSIDIALQSH